MFRQLTKTHKHKITQSNLCRWNAEERKARATFTVWLIRFNKCIELTEFGFIVIINFRINTWFSLVSYFSSLRSLYIFSSSFFSSSCFFPTFFFFISILTICFFELYNIRIGCQQKNTRF